ncbi:MAG TPA: DMT family transporter [Chitinophagaceae bacterium]
MPKDKLTLAGFLITLVGAILFSTKAIIVKLAFAQTAIDAVALLTLRMVFSLPFYLVAALVISNREGNVRMTGRQMLLTLGLGLLGYYLSSLFDFLGLQYISAGLERLILFLYPTFAVLITTFVFKQHLGRNQKWALVLTYIGIGIAYFGELQIDKSAQFLLGSLLVFLCAVTYSGYISFSGRIIPQVGALKFTAYAMLAATLGVFAHFLVTSGDLSLLASPRNWEYGLLLAVLATVIPSFLLSLGLKKIGANNVAIISSIGPVSTILQAHYILGEPIFPAQLVGTGLVIAGVLLLTPKRKIETA